MLAAAPAASAARRLGARPAIFHVGAAVRSTEPNVAVFSGGFGLSPPITRMHDPLTVRAFYVAGRHHAVAFVTVDAQGYFAAYQESPKIGITDERAQAAKRISALRGAPGMSQAATAIQPTPPHAGPPPEGTWEPPTRVSRRRV